MKSLSLCLLAILLGACAGAANGKTAADKNVSSHDAVAHVGAPAPDWSEPLVPKGTLALSSLRGHAVYLNFFATWCPPCNDEAPTLNALQKAYGPSGLQIVGIDVLENATKASEFRTKHSLVYPAVVDDGTLRSQYNVNGLPVHVFIDRSGVVRNVVVGELEPAEMKADVLKLLHPGGR